MEPHERVLADIDAAYLELCGQVKSIDDGDRLIKLRKLAEVAVLHPCSQPKAIRVWEGGRMMVVYHVTTLKKLHRYIARGSIKGPVRAWKKIESAERFSKQTGRRLIIRLKFPETAKQLFGHRGEAVYLDEDLEFPRYAV